jgi:hypothetical protein
VAVLLGSGCVNGGGNPDQCAGWRPIILTGQAIDALTEDEAAEILAHNEFGAERCGWKP